MAVVSSPLPEIADRVARLPDTALLAVVKAVKKDADRVAKAVAGPDQRLSNAGKKGAKLRTRDTWRRGAKRADIYAVPPGPWKWMDTGTGPHVIGVGRANKRTGNYSSRRFKNRKVLVIGGRYVTAPVFHPGTSGKGAWRRVKREAANTAPQEWARQVRKALSGG